MSLQHLSRLLPLPDGELQQVLDYANTLSKPEAAEHFGNLLGNSPRAIEFISAFNSRRQAPGALVSAPATAVAASSSSTHATDIAPVPKGGRGGKKKKQNIHTPAPRQITGTTPAPGTVYNKKDQHGDYISGTSSNSGINVARRKTPPVQTPAPRKPKVPPSAAGALISDVPKPKPNSNPVSRTSTPGLTASGPSKPTKVTVTGGTPMHGASTAVADLDAAIRALEITTNPTLLTDAASRKCDCVATRHPLQTAAPNCLNCGKVICLKEGLGPCTFCGAALLGSNDIQAIIQELKADRGREKMAADRAAHKKADVGRTPAPFSKPRDGTEALSAAEAQRDRLLGFQAQNARRTTVRDEAADFDYSMAGGSGGSGGSMWTTPEERAQELKRQQKIMREMEWNARPEYDKRKQVISIDLAGGKVVKKMADVEKPTWDDDELEDTNYTSLKDISGNRGLGATGAFSKNPLLGSVIKPVYNVKGKGSAEGRKDRKKSWRRAQMDDDDNAAIILDGGAYGSTANQGDVESVHGGDEPACG